MTTFTGERPGRGPGYEYDHARHQIAYDVVAGMVDGEVVVDAGSGDGTGASLFAERASRVVGLDHHAGAVAEATRVHGSSHVAFEQADLAAPWPVEDADTVVALQVIEHIEDDDAFVRHAMAALRPGGRLLLTTPNRLLTFSDNPWHVREYTAEQLRSLLARHGEVELRGVFGNDRVTAFDERRRAEVQRWLRLDPWNLRSRLPRAVVDPLFATLSTVVRRRASAGGGPDAAPIEVSDFEVRDGDLDACLDLFAVVHRR